MNYDPLDTCPYDPVHRILRSRMQFHLTKCSKNFPSCNKKQCPYDARHIVNQVEFNYHISNCRARESVWHYKLQDEEALIEQKLVPIDIEPAVPVDENWDHDIQVKTYNPNIHVETRPIARTLIGASKAQRKKFRMQERDRVQQIENQREKQNKIDKQKAAAAANLTGPNLQQQSSNGLTMDNMDEQDKPLRRPKKLQPDTTESNKAAGQGNSNAKISETKSNTVTVDKKAQNNTEQQTITVQNNPDQNETVQHTVVQNNKENRNAIAKPVPFSYAAALNKSKTTNVSNNKSSDSDSDVVIEAVKYDDSLKVNNSFFNRTVDDSVIEKLSRTVEEITVDDEGHRKKTEPLNKQLEKLKKLQNGKNNATNKSTENGNTTKKFSRCAANFPALK